MVCTSFLIWKPVAPGEGSRFRSPQPEPPERLPCASADGVPLALRCDLEAALAVVVPDPFHLFDVFQPAGFHLRLFPEPAQGRRFESVSQRLPAICVAGAVALHPDVSDAGGFIEFEVPALAASVDLGPLDLEAGLQSAVPDGAVPLNIPDILIDRLQESTPETLEDLTSLLDDSRAVAELIGFDFQDGKVSMTFPFDETQPTKWTAYANLLNRIYDAAMKATP